LLPTQPKSCLSKYFIGIFSFSLILTRELTENEENKYFSYLPTHPENAGSGYSKQTIILGRSLMKVQKSQ
jgi:hypothetical protein